MENDVKQRLREFIAYKGMTIRDFEKSIEKSNGYVKNLHLGLPKSIEAILNAYPELSLSWLVQGTGDMLTSPQERPVGPIGASVPIVDTFAIGGTLTEQLDAENVGALERVPCPIAGAQMAIEVSGDSMSPEYPSGSRLFCRRVEDLSFIEWGRVYVVDTTSGAIVKQLSPGKKGFISCHSLNESGRYLPFEIPISSVRAIFKILGVFILK